MGQCKLPPGFAEAYHNRATAYYLTGRIGPALDDLRQVRDWSAIESTFDPARETWFDFADGTLWHWRPSYRWHLWRRGSILLD